MFILQNQDGYFLSKSGDWSDGREPNTLFRTLHRDEAVNQSFEANSQNYNLRITIITCEMSPKKIPIIADELLPPPTLPAEAPTTNIATNDDAGEPGLLLASDDNH